MASTHLHVHLSGFRKAEPCNGTVLGIVAKKRLVVSSMELPRAFVAGLLLRSSYATELKNGWGLNTEEELNHRESGPGQSPCDEMGTGRRWERPMSVDSVGLEDSR